MKILYFRRSDKLFPGIVTDKGIVDVCRLSDKLQPDTVLGHADMAELKKAVKAAGPQHYLDEADLTIASCVPFPPKIICIGLNYRKHAEESGMPVPVVPLLFSKYSNTLVDFGEDVYLGQEGEHFDYEVELGVVIGKNCKNVSKEEALSYVFGYCTANDLSCRDLQFKTSQWLLGKSLDHFLPLGKYVVTADEVGDPQNLELSCELNGEVRQHSNTSDMVFSVAEIIAYLSRFMTLTPGDIILTGTPSGVIMGLPEKNWLKPGDVVKVEIEKLGATTNTMI